VSYYSTSDLEASVVSIREASSKELELVVVDNADGDPELGRLLERHPEIHVIDAQGNVGYGRAVNLAAARLSPEIDWILIVNPDTVFTKGAVDELLRVAEIHPEAGALGPRIVDPDGSVYPSARALPSLRVGIGHALFARFWPDNRWSTAYRRSDLTAPQLTDPVPTGWLSGACVLVRRPLFDSIGGFDPRYFMYFEDVDLGKRIGEARAVNLYVPSARVTHIGGQSTKRHSRRMIVVHHRSAFLYLSEKYSGWYLWPVRAVLRVALAARAFISSRGSR
jgi:N-acetylglucosaminyl-diphospho-decaprenol L-rhamnosyltransferase